MFLRGWVDTPMHTMQTHLALVGLVCSAYISTTILFSNVHIVENITQHTTFVNKELSFHTGTGLIYQRIYSKYKFIYFRWRQTNRWVSRARKLRFSGTQKPVLLKASSRECCATSNFVLLVTLGCTFVHLIVYLPMHQMKQIMERQMLKQIQV